MIRFHHLLCFCYKKGETFGKYAVSFMIYSNAIWLCGNPKLTCVGTMSRCQLIWEHLLPVNICNTWNLIKCSAINDAYYGTGIPS